MNLLSAALTLDKRRESNCFPKQNTQESETGEALQTTLAKMGVFHGEHVVAQRRRHVLLLSAVCAHVQL